MCEGSFDFSTYSSLLANLLTAFEYEPTICRHDVLCWHVVPSTGNLLTAIVVAITVTKAEVCYEWELALNSTMLRNPLWETSPCAKRRCRAIPLHIITVVFQSYAWQWVYITTGECTLKESLVVVLLVHCAWTGVVAPETAVLVLTPCADIHLLSTFIWQWCPSVIHSYNPKTLIKSFSTNARLLCFSDRIACICFTTVVKHEVCNLSVLISITILCRSMWQVYSRSCVYA